MNEPLATHAAVLVFWLALGACAVNPVDPRYPPLPENCAVQLFQGSPVGSTDGLGSVSATCDPSISEQDCLQTLKAQTCKLGGDVVWGVQSDMRYGKKHWVGRAAHTKP